MYRTPHQILISWRQVNQLHDVPFFGLTADECDVAIVEKPSLFRRWVENV